MHFVTQIVELVHSDIYGPFKVQSLGGVKYFVTFMDNYSHNTWFYMMMEKWSFGKIQKIQKWS
jgi:hypothetical protein